MAAKIGAGSFSSQIDNWTAKTEARMEAVFHKSAEMLAEEIIFNTPVDTGFLRQSFEVSTSGPPDIRPDARPAPGGSYITDMGPIYSVIANIPLGRTIYMGFVAAYANHVEYGTHGRAGRAMVRRAVQKWPQIVDKAIAEAKREVNETTVFGRLKNRVRSIFGR